MQPFVVNRHDRIVFPSNFMPELDLSVIHSLDQLDNVIRRDFETKAPTGTEILHRVEVGAYSESLRADARRRAEHVLGQPLCHDDVREAARRAGGRAAHAAATSSCRSWRRGRDGDRKVAAVQERLRRRCRRPGTARSRTASSGSSSTCSGTASTMRASCRRSSRRWPRSWPIPSNLTFRLPGYDPDYPVFGYADIVDCAEDVPELEALHRWAMVLHNQYPWDRAQAELVEVGELRGRRLRRGLPPARPRGAPLPATRSASATAWPRPAPRPRRRSSPSALPAGRRARAVLRACLGSRRWRSSTASCACTNEDLIRNAAYNWSPMAADEIREKTGIEERRLHLAHASRRSRWRRLQAALEQSGRGPEEIGAVLVCTCTSTRMIPSVATWISGQLGIYQTHASCDIVAACAGLPYGLSEAMRILQEVERPVLVVCVEKFSDKIGNVRPSRMIFGDGAAAVVARRRRRRASSRTSSTCRPTPAVRRAR